MKTTQDEMRNSHLANLELGREGLFSREYEVEDSERFCSIAVCNERLTPDNESPIAGVCQTCYDKTFGGGCNPYRREEDY